MGLDEMGKLTCDEIGRSLSHVTLSETQQHGRIFISHPYASATSAFFLLDPLSFLCESDALLT